MKSRKSGEGEEEFHYLSITVENLPSKRGLHFTKAFLSNYAR